MIGDPGVIVFLNRQLTNELTAVNQYFLHARIYRHWGLRALGKHEYDESIEEMKHADLLIERILMLDGLPNLQDLNKLMIGETTPEMLGCDLEVELASQTVLKEGMAHCEVVHDYVSRDLLRKILYDTEGTHRVAGDAHRPDRPGRAGELPAIDDGRARIGLSPTGSVIVRPDPPATSGRPERSA